MCVCVNVNTVFFFFFCSQVQAGLSGDYLVRFFGNFMEKEGVVQKGGQRYLSFALDLVRASVVTLSLSADDLLYIVNRYPARARPLPLV